MAVPSLCGGVQSSPLLLTACAGELTPPDTVIFSDSTVSCQHNVAVEVAA